MLPVDRREVEIGEESQSRQVDVQRLEVMPACPPA